MDSFSSPSNPETSHLKINHNIKLFSDLQSSIYTSIYQNRLEPDKISSKKYEKLKYIDENIVKFLSNEFNDGVFTYPLIGDIIRTLKKPYKERFLMVKIYKKLL